MSKDNSEWPDLQVELKDVVKILQSGGRITRSKRNPPKCMESRSRERSRILQRYDGQACLSSYLSNANIRYEQPIREQYLLNKNMKRLNKVHLPQSCIFYQKAFGGHLIKQVKLIGKKCKNNEFIIEQRQQLTKIPQARSVTSSEDGLLGVVQTLVFLPLQFQQFCRLFRGSLNQVKEQFKTAKYEEIAQKQLLERRQESQIKEEQEGRGYMEVEEDAGEKMGEKMQYMVQIEQEEVQNGEKEVQDIQNIEKKGEYEEIKENIEGISQSQEDIKQKKVQEKIDNSQVRDEKVEQARQVKNQQQNSVQVLQQMLKELEGFDLKIFSKLSHNSNFILWPAVVLQPLIGDKHQFQIMVAKEEAMINQQQVMKGPRQELKMLQALVDEMMEQRGQISDKQLEGNRDELNLKCERLRSNFQSLQWQEITAHLIGSDVTKMVQKDYIKWQQFTQQQLNELLMRGPLRHFVQQFNIYIHCLNKFKALENSAFEGKHSFFRVGKYQQAGNMQLCIPIRCDQSKDGDKRVLVRLLTDREQKGADLLKWVEYSKLKVNLTLPKQIEDQKKFYYLMGSLITIQQGLNYLYSDFYNLQVDFISVLRRCYPLNELKKAVQGQQRCIYCYYCMEHFPCYRCKYCSKFTHQECVSVVRLKKYEGNGESMALDIYETGNDERVWQCEGCSPCSECHMAVGQDYLKCISCLNLLHQNCGKLKGMIQRCQADKYTCESCLKCRMCSNRLKNQEYIFEQKSIFCLKCYKDFKNDQYCAVCMREMGGKWVQCDKRDCKKWIHLVCDKYFKGNKDKEPIDKVNYICPYCRLKERRKVFKWVVEELRYFDQYQYFYDAEYQDIFGYTEVINNPMCIFRMREKACDGSYDDNAYESIKEDLELLVRNALTFNMPKDEPHYRAKILHIVGLRFIQDMKELLLCNQQFLVNENPQEIFKTKRKKFYNDLYDNYLSYLLNFRMQRNEVEVRNDRKGGMLIQDEEFFSSKIILSRSFANSEFRFKIKKKPHKIENLFTIPRLASAGWWPIRTRVCYYHPLEENQIVFQCEECGECYCCTTRCWLHRICGLCGGRGCGCDSYQCGCAPVRDKDKKGVQTKIMGVLGSSKLQRREYSQYFKYCLRCVLQNLKTNWCYLCGQYCYYNYEKCFECGLMYHSSCEGKRCMEELGILARQDYKTKYADGRLSNMCYRCSLSPRYVNTLRQKLMADIKKKAIKLKTIHKYLTVFGFLYDQNGIRLTLEQVIELVYSNYSSFVQRQAYFEQFLLNMPVIIESGGNTKLIKNEFRDCFMNDITRKLVSQNSHPHDRCVSFVQTTQMKQLKQSKKYFKIYSKWFNNVYFPINFLNSYQIKYHLQHLTSKMSHTLPTMIKDNTHLDQPMVTNNFKEDVYFNYKHIERIKIEVITSYVSPKSKKNVYYTNKVEKFKIYHNFWQSYYSYKALVRNRANRDENNSDIQGQMLSDRKRIEREYQKYLRFHADHESLPDCIYKEQNSKSLLFQKTYRDTFNSFQENIDLVSYKALSFFKEGDLAYVNNKSQMLCRYLSDYCLKIFEENKVVLKKGSTCILNEGKNNWRVLKKYRRRNVEVKLEYKHGKWCLNVDAQSSSVEQIQDIVAKLKQISPTINTFEDVADFMGFSMTDSQFYEPNHFTHLLQTVSMDDLNRRQRKEHVNNTYETYKWHRQGNFSIQRNDEGNKNVFRYNVTKKQVFYLKKRGQKMQEEEVEKVVPYITFQDIKKDLWQGSTCVVREKDSFVIREPTNDVYVAPSKIDRLGLFINKYSKKNTIVTEYIGEIISEAMADVRQKSFHFGCYMFGLTKNHTRFQIIDATFVGNSGRYLNHSCDVLHLQFSLTAKLEIEMVDGKPRIFIYTIRDIPANEELTYDYQFKVDSNQRLTCKCKSHNCQGRLT